MAEVDVKHQSTSQSSEGKQQGLQRQSGGGVSRSRGGDPFSFSPAEFFSNPFGLMRRMSEEMDRQFGQSFGQQGGAGSSSAWYPAIEVSEHEGQLQVHAELPGLKPEDVKVEVTDDALVIRGERKSEHEHRLGSVYRSERRYGEFYREIPLPEGTNAEQARAQFRNGVLEVIVPVQQQASKRREIPISTGEGHPTGAGSGSESSGRSSAAGAGAGSSGSSSQGGTSGQPGSQKRS